MFGTQFIASQLRKSTRRIQVTRPLRRVVRGALVRTPEGDVGFVQFVKISPYHDEAEQGIKRAYVYSATWENGKRWTDYCLLNELQVIG